MRWQRLQCEVRESCDAGSREPPRYAFVFVFGENTQERYSADARHAARVTRGHTCRNEIVLCLRSKFFFVPNTSDPCATVVKRGQKKEVARIMSKLKGVEEFVRVSIDAATEFAVEFLATIGCCRQVAAQVGLGVLFFFSKQQQQIFSLLGRT